MKKYSLFLALLALTLVSAAQDLKIGFLTNQKLKQADVETAAAWEFLSSQPGISSLWLTPKNASKPAKINSFDAIWVHLSDTNIRIADVFSPNIIASLKTYAQNGGNLLLTQEAFPLINLLEIETEKPVLVNKQAKDSGYGRMLGFHSFRSHPVFDGLNGGAYILKPSADITVRNYGFFGDTIPAAGKVVATDWDYIFLREDKKMIVEYEVGKGKILAVGGYMYFKFPEKQQAKADETYNVNRQHLEKFTLNCLDYLAGMPNIEAHFWNYQPPKIESFVLAENAYFPMLRPTIKSHQWEINESKTDLHRRFATVNFWDVAGERLLIMGKETGGIDEIWAHPFMAFRDYEVGIKFDYRDTIYWLTDEKPMITIHPESFERLYQFKRAFLKEIICVSPDQPQAVVHYEYRGVYPAEIFIRFKSNQRMMWPYSEKVLGGIKYTFDQKLNAFIITDPSGDFVSMLGFNKNPEPVNFSSSQLLPSFKPVICPVGHYNEIFAVDSVWKTKPADGLKISGLAKINLEMNDNFDVIVSAGSEGISKAITAFQMAQSDPEKVYKNALLHQENISGKMLSITTPDAVFNTGFAWAVNASDRFFVTTPGIGGSLVAGYGTTENGWDGEHKVNGRPGYAWYFGRDSEWSAFALLGYGDFGKVKSVIGTLQKFQDLNGKIFHELSTSGFAHYDASDATPLYVVLAGRYLKHSGDKDFISESWKNIKAAMDFMYSTDTDGDGLIENTNVGHGWVEGGGLFGSHTSLYLASCWAEALSEAAFIAQNLGFADLATKYETDKNEVIHKINALYWNEEQQYFYHGVKQDGSFIEEKSIMPTIPVLFGQVEKNRSREVLKAFAKNEFTANWGVRIVSERSPLFRPQGYHTGSVWPLFTGWTALAEYEAGRGIQGFSHIMNNLQVYDDWALGFVEEVLNGAEYQPSGVCSHQCWSETMVLQPAIEGMLGLKPDATKNFLAFSPDFPANWDRVNIENIRIGGYLLGFEQIRKGNKVRFNFSHQGDSSLKIQFSPRLPSGTQILEISLDGIIQKFDPQNLAVNFEILKTSEIEISFKNGIEVLPFIAHPKPGESPEGSRIIETKFVNGIYEISFEGKSGSSVEFEVYINSSKIKEVINAKLISQDDRIFRFSLDFPETDSKYATKTVKILTD